MNEEEEQGGEVNLISSFGRRFGRGGGGEVDVDVG